MVPEMLALYVPVPLYCKLFSGRTFVKRNPLQVIGTAFIIIGQKFLHQFWQLPEDFKLIELFPVFATHLGSCVCILSLLGFLATILKSPIWIKVYAFCMTILFVVQITFCTYYLIKQEEVNYKSTAIVFNAWKDRENNPDTLDGVQLIGRCCGLESPSDYNGKDLPTSCCGYEVEDEGCKLDGAYEEGCASGFPRVYLNNSCWIIYYGYFIAGIELGAMIIAWFVELGEKEVVNDKI